MSDAAAFFASKKKKKKGFKGFNANKIDAAAVTSAVHVDAPALSTDTDGITEKSGLSGKLDVAGSNGDASKDQWDDEALAATMTKKATVSSGASSATTELLDMKALEVKRREQDDFAERLKVEETKAQLAAAKEGMEREAQRLKDEAEAKKAAQAEKEAATAAKATSSGTGGLGGGRWLPPHLRAGGAASLTRTKLPGAKSQLDTQDDNMFPDLAAADEILEKKQEETKYKLPKKTAVGGGASWASPPAIAPQVPAAPQQRPKLNLKPKSKSQATTEAPAPSREEIPPASTPAPVDEPSVPSPEAEAPRKEEAPKPAAAAPTPKKKPTKRKKKDLSTFRPS